MLLPGFLGHIADKAVELWEQLNLFAIRDICRRIADAGNHMTASAEWQIYKMEQSGMSRDAIMRAVSRIMKLSDEEVRRIFEEAAVQSHNNDADIFSEAGVQPEPFGTEQAGKSMQVYYEQTNNELRNFMRTTANQSQEIFINACDGAFLAVQSGLKSSAEAIRDAIDDAARDGLYVHYPSGHRDTVEVAVRRAVMTGVNRAALQMTVDECQRTGTNYVIVSSHLGARVSDSNPIADHAGWQGKIYRLSNERESFWGKLKGFLPFLRGRKYPLLREATGYPDDPLGLGGYNCRHSMYPYIPGVTENHMKQFDPEKNRKAYEDSQRQRAMEREIRKKKRQVEGLKAAAEASEGEQLEAIEELLKKRKKELADLTAKYRQFCKDNGLSENLERTYIAKGKQPQAFISSADKMSAKKKYNGSVWPKTGKIIDEQTYKELLQYAKARNIRLIDFRGFDGDVEIVREFADQLQAIGTRFPALFGQKGVIKVQLSFNAFSEPDDDYAMNTGGTIVLNGYALRDRTILEADYAQKVKEHWFTQGSTYRDIIVHEAGHYLTRTVNFDGIKLIGETFGQQDEMNSFTAFFEEISEYSLKNNSELAAECFVKYWNGNRSGFVLKVLNLCGIL